MNIQLGSSVLVALAVVIWLLWLGSKAAQAKRLALANATQLAGVAMADVAKADVAIAKRPEPNVVSLSRFSSATALSRATAQTQATQGHMMQSQAAQPQEATMDHSQTPSTKAAFVQPASAKARSVKPLSVATPSATKMKADSAKAEFAQANPAKATKPAPLNVHYGRLVIAAVGALALLAVPVTLVVRLLGRGSWMLPIACALIFVAAVAGLRFLAMRSRRRKVEDAFRAAMGPQTVSEPKAHASAAVRSAGAAHVSVDSQAGRSAGARGVVESVASTKVFDVADGARAEHSDGAGSGKAGVQLASASRLTVAQLREAAMASAEGAVVREDGTWEPVEVPKPSYVAAAKAERPAPAPLALPEQPKPSGSIRIKAAEAGVVAPAKPEVAPSVGSAGSGVAPARRRAAQNDLDSVLQRRRA